MGKAGDSAFEYGIDRACASGQFPSGHRLGGIYGRGDHGLKRAGQAHRIYPVGYAGPEKGTDAEQSPAPDLKSAPSKSIFRCPGIFRKQAVQSDQRVSGGTRAGTDRLADRIGFPVWLLSFYKNRLTAPGVCGKVFLNQ